MINLGFSRKIIVNDIGYCDCGYKHYQELVDKVLKDFENFPHPNITIQTKFYNTETNDVLGFVNINFVGIDKLIRIHPFISYGSYGNSQSFFDGFGFLYIMDKDAYLRLELFQGNVYINNILITTDNDVKPIVNCNTTYSYYLTNIKKENEIPLYVNQNLVISLFQNNNFEINFNILDVVPEI